MQTKMLKKYVLCSLIKQTVVWNIPKICFYQAYPTFFYYKNNIKSSKINKNKQTHRIISNSCTGLYPSKVDTKLRNHHPEAPLKHAKNGQLFFATSCIPKMMMVVAP